MTKLESLIVEHNKINAMLQTSRAQVRCMIASNARMARDLSTVAEAIERERDAHEMPGSTVWVRL